MSETTNTYHNRINEDVEYAQYRAAEAVAALQSEIIASIGRLSALHAHLSKIEPVIGKLTRGDFDGHDHMVLFSIGMLAPLPEDTDADTVGYVLQGHTCGMDLPGETTIGWSIANVERNLQRIEADIAKDTPPDNDWYCLGVPKVEDVPAMLKDLVVDGKVGVKDYGDRIEIIPGDVAQEMWDAEKQPEVQG